MAVVDDRKKQLIKWGVIGLSAIIVLVVVATVLDRFQFMEQQIASLTAQVDRSARDAREAAVAAEQSSKLATEARNEAQQAEQTSRQAIEAKQQAIEEKVEAEKTASAAEEEAEKARAEADQIRKDREAELDRMQQALDRIVDTRRTAFGLVMNLPESALRFDFDSAYLKPQSKEVLSRIAGILLASDSFGLSVHGHTDDVGDADYNQQLSERRAEAVKEYLVSAGIDPAIVHVKGYGKSSPIARGDDDDSRAKNRRVEIALTDIRIQYTEAKN